MLWPKGDFEEETLISEQNRYIYIQYIYSLYTHTGEGKKKKALDLFLSQEKYIIIKSQKWKAKQAKLVLTVIAIFLSTS